jgi:capsular polysaccharide export protein
MQRISVPKAPVDDTVTHVVLASDAKFLPFCAATISSAIKNSNKRDRLAFHVLCDVVPTADHLLKFRRITAETNATVRFIPADSTSFSTLRTNLGISSATYYRLGITNILEKEIPRVVYIDCDLVVLGRIKDLYSIDMQGNALVGVEDGSSGSLAASTNQKKGTKHVNGGVLVLDLEKLRAIDFPSLVERYVAPRTFTIHMGDQQILCGVLQGQIGYVGAEWNLHGSMHSNKWRMTTAGYTNTYTVTELEKASRSPKVIHFTSSRKPWQKGNTHPKAKVFMDYLARTPYGPQYREKVESDRVATVDTPSIRVVHDTIHNAFLMKTYHEMREGYPVSLGELLTKHGPFAKITTNLYKQDIDNGNAENHKILFRSNNLAIPTHDASWEESAFSALVRWKNSEPLQMRILHNAIQRNKPVLFVETGFFAGYASWAEKALHPQLRRPLGFIIDDLNFYYDATRPSRLELTLNSPDFVVSDVQLQRAQALIAKISDSRITKYNIMNDHDPEISWRPEQCQDFVLVIDQGVGDASIELGLASSSTFATMLRAAIDENPGKTVVVKVHPDTLAAGRNGNFGFAASLDNVVFLTKPVNPHLILDKVGKVYVVSSQLGFEALLCGKEVVCFGVPFYAGWGLTEDRAEVPRRTARRSIEELFHAACIQFTVYIDPYTGEWCTMERCIELIEEMRANPALDLASPVKSAVNINAEIKSMRLHRLFKPLITPFYNTELQKRISNDPEKFYEQTKHPLVKKVGRRILSKAITSARKRAEIKTPTLVG